MKKLLILFGFLLGLGLAGEARAQYYGYFYGGYYPWGWNYSTAAFAVDQGFATLQQTWTAIEQTQALENHIQVRRNNLENYKSVKNYYTTGIPPFAPVSPEGKPRSPKITWQDVESIGH
ncbi:hypothetical protein FBR05_12780 [Deltaproteobacteria bacterium PRO3]|nr:hypothetical protein [Deltaproteobacteria bacterium PRO3]